MRVEREKKRRYSRTGEIGTFPEGRKDDVCRVKKSLKVNKGENALKCITKK